MTTLLNHLIIKRCPHCRVDNPNITENFNLITQNFDGGNLRYWRIYVCSRCGGVITAASDQQKGWVRELYPSEIVVDDCLPNKAKVFLNQAIDSLHAPSGAIRWKSYYWVYLTAALKGKYVGIEELNNGIWKVFYRSVFLGYFDENELRNKESSTRLDTNLV